MHCTALRAPQRILVALFIFISIFVISFVAVLVLVLVVVAPVLGRRNPSTDCCSADQGRHTGPGPALFSERQHARPALISNSESTHISLLWFR